RDRERGGDCPATLPDRRAAHGAARGRAKDRAALRQAAGHRVGARRRRRGVPAAIAARDGVVGKGCRSAGQAARGQSAPPRDGHLRGQEVSLTAKDIAEIARLLDESHFSSLDLRVGDFKLRIRRDGGWSERQEDDEEDTRPAPESISGSEPPSPPSPPLGQEAGAARAGEIDVPAPLLGNFYAAPRPGEPPFI